MAGWRLVAWALLALLPGAAQGAISGVVTDGTTGEPAARVFVTLIQFEDGMEPVEETLTDGQGRFSMERSLAGAGGRRTPGMLRVEYQGVSYSKVLPPGSPTENLEVTVYSVVEEQPKPNVHIMLFEPSGRQMVVNESFIFANESNPPRTYRDAADGTLRFYVPPESQGVIRVTARGPAGMPLQQVARPAGEEDVYKVDFPIKPGSNQIDLVYLVPHEPGQPFQTRILYEGLVTRAAAPEGVTIEGEGVRAMDQHPGTQATIYELPVQEEIQLNITGEGQLAGREGAPAAGGGQQSRSPEIKIEPPPVAEQLTWILVLAGAILGIGLFYLYSSFGSEEAEQAAPAEKEPARQGVGPAPQPSPRKS